MPTPAELWLRLPWWARRLLVILDVLLNWKLGGVFGETISERLAVSRDSGEWQGQLGCQILDRFDSGHCDRALL